MPCCKACCGCRDCSTGQMGKCCCGGSSGSCCQSGERCCSGVCKQDGFPAFDGSNRRFKRLGIYDLDCCYLMPGLPPRGGNSAPVFPPDDGYYIVEKQCDVCVVVESARWYAAYGYAVGTTVTCPSVGSSTSPTWKSLAPGGDCCNDGTKIYAELTMEMGVGAMALSIGRGPGTELKALLKKIGIVASPGCPCNARAAEMDDKEAKEPGWCEKNIEQICDWLQEEAAKRHLPFLRAGAKVLIRRAISNARKKGQ